VWAEIPGKISDWDGMVNVIQIAYISSPDEWDIGKPFSLVKN
jgi:hypothetical protein